MTSRTLLEIRNALSQPSPSLLEIRNATTQTSAKQKTKTDGLVIVSLANRPKETYLDTKALAMDLGVTPRTIRRMRDNHHLPPSVKIGRRAMWQVGRVLAHFEARAEREAREAERAEARLRKKN